MAPAVSIRSLPQFQMKPAFSRLGVAVAAPTLALAVAAGSTSNADGQTSGRCIAPRLVGVSFAMARRALEMSGCRVVTEELPASGSLVAPEPPDGRQIVARQSPAPGARSGSVTVWLKPLCAQSAEPGPNISGPSVKHGPTELVSGLFLVGGPLRLSPYCRSGTSAAGTITVFAATGGRVISKRAVHSGGLAVFPLPAGSYLVQGTFANSTANGRPISTPTDPVKIAARRITRHDLLVNIP
jgi:hypothetical protein